MDLECLSVATKHRSKGVLHLPRNNMHIGKTAPCIRWYSPAKSGSEAGRFGVQCDFEFAVLAAAVQHGTQPIQPSTPAGFPVDREMKHTG